MTLGRSCSLVRRIVVAVGLLLIAVGMESSVTTALTSPQFLRVGQDTASLAYHEINSDDERIGVLCLTGFRSDMTGSKALALEAYCQRAKRHYVRFDYRGHGASTGNFEDLCLSDWINDGLSLVDQLFHKNRRIVLVGSSMGAWIAIHIALQRRIVAGIVTVAAAPDFTETLWNELSPQQQTQLQQTRVYYRPSKYSPDDPYPITYKLMMDGRKWLLLEKEEVIPFHGPIHLLHGRDDNDIPWQVSLKLSRLMKNAKLTLVEKGDHRFSSPSDLATLVESVDQVLADLEE